MSYGWRALLRRRAERLLRPGGRVAILLYHRVAEDAADPYGICMTPARFEEHLLALKEVAQPLSLPALVRAIREGKVPDGGVCVTFDDGYVDNLTAAKPLLAGHDVPATVFVTTGRAGREREFWWDELQRVFFEPAELPSSLEITIGGSVYQWQLGQDARYPSEDARRRVRWHAFDVNLPSARHASFQQAYPLIRPLPAEERTRVIDGLLAWAGLDASDVRESRRALEPPQVAELARDGLVQVGAHTVTHPALPSQTAEVQRYEASRSRADLQEWLGAEVAGFAYPYGLYDASSVGAVREAGFAWACSCLPHAASRRSELLLLPRIEVPDCSGDELVSLLRWELYGEPSRQPRVTSG